MTLVYKHVGVRFAVFISFFLNIPCKWNNLVSLRPNYFIFIGYFLKNGGRGGVRTPWNPIWTRHWFTLHFSNARYFVSDSPNFAWDTIRKMVCGPNRRRHGRIQMGDRGSGPHLKNRKNIGFLSNTGPDPLKNHKVTKPTINVGPSSARQWNAI